MAAILKWVKEHLTVLILVAIPIALLAGYYIELGFLKDYINLVLFMMIYPMMINLKVTDVFDSLKKPKPILFSLVVNFIMSPILAYGLGMLFFKDNPELLLGIVLISLIPTSGMTASWTGLAGGSLQTSLVMMSVNLLVSIVAIPIYLNLLMGELVAVNTMVIVSTLIKVVIIPLILGDLTRRLILKYKGKQFYKEVKPLFGGISSLGVVVIVFIALALKSRTIVSNLNLVLLSAIPLVIYYGVLMVSGHYVGHRVFGRQEGISLVYSTTLRNLTIALGISLSYFGESMAVFLIALAYVIQLPFASMYMKRMNKVKLKVVKPI